MAREAGSGKGMLSVVVPLQYFSRHALPAPKRVDISDDNAIVRLGVTYGVLRRLGYSEETVTRCLESVDGLDLEEAHEWVGGYRCGNHSPTTFLHSFS